MYKQVGPWYKLMAYLIWLEIWLTVTSKSEQTILLSSLLAFIAAFNYLHTLPFPSTTFKCAFTFTRISILLQIYIYA